MTPEEAAEFESQDGIGMIPAAIFTGGLDFEQEVTLQTINECLDRGQAYAFEMAKGNEELRHQFEPLYRVLTGLAIGSIIPVLKRINEGASPPQALKEVIAGVGGLMFFGGIEYAKAMGLNGVGVSLPKRKYADDQYPEQKPSGDLPEGKSLADFLSNISFDDDGREE